MKKNNPTIKNINQRETLENNSEFAKRLKITNDRKRKFYNTWNYD